MTFQSHLVKSVDEDLTRQLQAEGRLKPGQFAYNYTLDDTAPEGHGLMLTGPVAGIVTLNDGTEYDVTPECIDHAPGHAEAILFHIEEMHRKAGTFGPDWTGSGFEDKTGDAGAGGVPVAPEPGPTYPTAGAAATFAEAPNAISSNPLSPED